MHSLSETQGGELLPPRRGAVLAFDVDSTARPYNLSSLELGGETPEAGDDLRKDVVLWMQAETNDVYFYFHTATANDLSDTAKITAGGAAAFATTYGAIIEAGQPPIRVRINRSVDKWLVLKAASTAGVLRVWAASSSS